MTFSIDEFLKMERYLIFEKFSKDYFFTTCNADICSVGFAKGGVLRLGYGVNAKVLF